MRLVSVLCQAVGPVAVVLSLSLRLLLQDVGDAYAQPPEFKLTNNPQMISIQARLALPNAQRALDLLTSRTDAESLTLVWESSWLSYRYLRAAQELIEGILRQAKFPDPLLALHKDKMWEVRLHLLKCVDNRGHLLRSAASSHRHVY
jgi:hypothetical protein